MEDRLMNAGDTKTQLIKQQVNPSSLMDGK